MIHTYCCTKCGERFPGYNIAFDLVELLDMDLETEPKMSAMDIPDAAEQTNVDDYGQKDDKKDTDATSPDSSTPAEFVNNLRRLDVADSSKDNLSEKKKLTYGTSKESKRKVYKDIHAFVTPEELKEIAEGSGVCLKDNQPVSIRINLRQFLKYMTIGNEEKGYFANIVLNDATEDKEVISLLANLLPVGATRKSNDSSVAKKCWNRIREKFSNRNTKANEELQRIQIEKTVQLDRLVRTIKKNEKSDNQDKEIVRTQKKSERVDNQDKEIVRTHKKIVKSVNQEKAKIEKQMATLESEIKQIQKEMFKNIGNPKNYETVLEIIPEFFDKYKQDPDRNLYTIKYKKEGNFTYLRRNRGVFRGYCSKPTCRKPILRHTGKYPHRVVGMMGAQSAGKTTLITAMNVEIRNNSSLGVDAVTGAEVLYDSDSDKREKDYSLYEHGWAVSKTLGNAGNTYNVSFFLTDSTRKEDKVILTIADIAGEICYKTNDDTFDEKCFKYFPLIQNCDAYLVCACIDNDGYENNDAGDGEEQLRIPPKAVKTIASNILSYYKENGKIPPLCIVMTKADMVNDHRDNGNKDNDPFKIIVPESEKYMFARELSALSSTYRITEKPSIQKSLDLCAETYQQIKKDTYTAILSVAATGRTAIKYNKNEAEIATNRMEYYKLQNGETGLFERKRVDELWKWILKVCGVVPVHHRYKFPEIPSFFEYYSKDDSHVYNIDNCLKRVNALEYVAINRSNSDIDIYDANEMGIGLSERVSMRGIRLWMGREDIEKEIKRKRILDVMPVSFEQSKKINTIS